MEETQKHETEPKPVLRKEKTHGSAVYVTLAILVVLFLFAQYQLVQIDAKVDVLTAMGSVDIPVQNNNAGNNPTAVAKLGDSPTVQKTDVVLIEEFSDFECPFCGRAAPTVEQLKAEYGDKIKVVLKHFPLSFHQTAQKAAEAYEAAKAQGKAQEMHDLMFQNQKGLQVDNLRKFAEQLGLDMEQFNSELDSGKYAAKVRADMAEGQRKGVTGTPAFFINGEKLVGAQPIENFRPIIDKYLA